MGLYTDIGKKYKSVTRYNQILKVLVKYGFKDLVQYLEEKKRFTFLQQLIPKRSRIDASKYTKWEKMRLVCEELGPTFIKFGQILSNRPDLVPLKLTFELEKLLDNVPPMPEEIAKQVVETELKGSVENLFAWFNPKPFASASMAQVHKVILHSGKRVALKIQRPGIKEIIIEDIKVMYSIAEVLEKRIPSIKSFDPMGLVKNFEDAILKELDFINESINVQRFYNNLADDDSADQYARAPKVYREYTTTKLLALEFMSGTKIDNLSELKEKNFDSKIIATRLTKSYFKQIFNYGFFHADPHPGNLLILPNGHICYLDFGMMGSILPRDIEVFGKLFLAITRKDVNKIIKALQQLSNYTNIENIRALEFDINEFVEKYYVRSVHKNELSTILIELKDIIIAHGLKVPTHFFLFARSLVTIEGVVNKLDPECNQYAIAKPFLLRAVAKSFNPIRFGEKALNSIYELGNYMEDFPRDLKNAIRKINRGEIKVDLTHKGIDPMVHTIHRVTKQLVSAFIMAALIIGAAMFIISGIKPLWGEISVLGIVCLVITIIIAYGMIRDIRKGDYDEWWYQKK
ncbi:AarF/ABC1/UbiB kinase family protein [Winogradskyella litoriviva]|uniref:AarF/ABC1/UbiB kinase family protein n=1 Tax=Winogradskyella litoriviva TaxID=1220182 RepID=A0ABX2E3V4_9FLAO|nr:AarF/ABC1/UbiB kinase family protein [Winogradskyella litoriviva]NRD23118.1 AarF/ABC1/UbiB kinase family protein [Winogradskyella litoriviva]